MHSKHFIVRRVILFVVVVIIAICIGLVVRPPAKFVLREPLSELQFRLSNTGSLAGTRPTIEEILRRTLHQDPFAANADVETLVSRLTTLNELLVEQMNATGMAVRHIDVLSLTHLGSGHYLAQLLIHFQPLYPQGEKAYATGACEDISYEYTMTFSKRQNRVGHQSRYVIESVR